MVKRYEEVANIMSSFYTQLLGQQEAIIPQIDKCVVNAGPVLTVEQQLKLCLPFLKKEIKASMFFILIYNSLSLNGYNSGFFKASWPIIGQWVYHVAQDFFNRWVMPKYLTTTKLVTLAKVLHLKKAIEVRPIS